ncbi:biotin synthesis protein BioC [Centipeda periodontii DSM 2778]|uniref:Biotin synthesis protein BioC n=1 Tax=Centipeda periodontii DSM 2778 TaxID=888060 RepID=F5RJ57_9FIRM|nr:class I SAM-dependent methyltransferase [Centipeda periodontii]EGK62043.1 biotin synthesis protein BioC [Centipeda periodontii DSM 2778]
MADDGRVLRQSISDNVMQLPSPIASMLDIGCGMGDMVMAWADRGMAATGLDISAEAIRHAEAAVQAAQRRMAVRGNA